MNKEWLNLVEDRAEVNCSNYDRDWAKEDQEKSGNRTQVALGPQASSLDCLALGLLL